ncbi:hypothetical protein [Pseudomonas sp. NFACC02]|uniref:hypothetical protein n=1 Tax=Pseudomonas sp. NFACC02 TaxID=1566250 RepID=UPI0021157DAE|nr:hypothetical protein [Pseudomonas sp. NFACC02]
MSDSKDVKMAGLREKMKALDVDINGKRNGIWLPNAESARVPRTSATPHQVREFIAMRTNSTCSIS